MEDWYAVECIKGAERARDFAETLPDNDELNEMRELMRNKNAFSIVVAGNNGVWRWVNVNDGPAIAPLLEAMVEKLA